jgi:hypothetical protein
MKLDLSRKDKYAIIMAVAYTMKFRVCIVTILGKQHVLNLN